MYLPSCFPIPDAQHNKYTLSALTLLHTFGKNTRICSPVCSVNSFRTQRNRRLKYYKQEILEHRKRRLNLATLLKNNTARLQNEIPEQREHRFSYTPSYTCTRSSNNSGTPIEWREWTERLLTLWQNACWNRLGLATPTRSASTNWFC